MMKQLIYFELKKIISRRLVIITFILLLMFSAMISISAFKNKNAFDRSLGQGSGAEAVKIDKELARKYEGELSDEKVHEMIADFAIEQDLNGLNATALYQNSIQSALFSRFVDIDGNWNGLSVYDVYKNEKIKVGYVDGYLTTSQNMTKVFVLLALLIIIMIAPVFSSEYEGVDKIILSSKYGKTKCITAKVMASILITVLTTTIVILFTLSLAFFLYGKDGLDSSILFAPRAYSNGFIPFNISCGTLIKYLVMLSFTCNLSITGLTLFISSISKKQIVALISSLAIFFLPLLLPITEHNPLFRLIGLLPIYNVLAISLLSIEQFSNGMLYAILAIPVSLLFLLIGAIFSRLVFSKQQVS